MDLGDRIRKRRVELGLTQRQLADALKVTPQHISVIEQNKRAPSLPSLVRLAGELGVTVDFLATGRESTLADPIAAIKGDAGLSLKSKKALIALVEELRGDPANLPRTRR